MVKEGFCQFYSEENQYCLTTQETHIARDDNVSQFSYAMCLEKNEAIPAFGNLFLEMCKIDRSLRKPQQFHSGRCFCSYVMIDCIIY